MKETERAQTDGKIWCAHGLEELILLKWPYYPRQSTDSMQSLLNINDIFSNEFIYLFLAALGHCCYARAFSSCGEQGLLFIAVHGLSMAFLNHKRPWITKTILREKNKAEVSHSPISNLLQSYSNQTSMVLTQKQTHRSMEQNREPRNEPTLIWAIIYNKRGKNIQWGKDSFFNESCWENWTATCKRTKLDYFLILCTKISSKWFKDLNVRPETIKLVEENISNTLFDIYIGNFHFFFDMSPQARETKAK